MRRNLVVFVLFALVPSVFGFAGSDPTSLSFALTRRSEPYVQSVVAWMVENTAEKVLDAQTTDVASDEQVRSYFAATGKLLRESRQGPSETGSVDALRAEVDAAQPSVEAAIQRKVATAAFEDGLGFRLWGVGPVPPVFFRFQAPPNLLVASPRSRIEREATVLLKPRLSIASEESIEAKTSDARTSTLVTAIGGLGVYPSMVPESSDPRWTIQTVAHEWTHQFLALRPLGFRYALGDENDPRMITVNETVAEVIGTELGNQVYSSLYPSEQAQAGGAPSARDATFRSLMRETRTRVDQLLAAGHVDQAERYMDESRQRLESQGFYIRKLNQAYFAFYGSYTQDPSAAGRTGAEISEGIQRLRERSASLSDFLWKLSGAGSYAEFNSLVSGG